MSSENKCEDCSHWIQDQPDDRYQDTGTCTFEFPPWLAPHKIPGDIDRTTNYYDSCSFFEAKCHCR